MIPKIITCRSRPKNKICKLSSSLFDEIICNEIFDGKINLKSKTFNDVMNLKKKKELSAKRKLKSRLQEDADQLPMTVCGFILMGLRLLVQLHGAL